MQPVHILGSSVFWFLSPGCYSHVSLLQSCEYFSLTGQCDTFISDDAVCALNSVATECSGYNATRCSCIEGYQQVDNLTCTGMF